MTEPDETLAKINKVALELFNRDQGTAALSGLELWAASDEATRTHYRVRAVRLIEQSEQSNNEIDALEERFGEID